MTTGLFDEINRQQFALLEASEYGDLLVDEKVVDLFCGAGGWEEGAAEWGIKCDFAINHSPIAIATHLLNNPHCIHHQGDAWKAKPRAIVGRSKIGVLFASAACTTHSRAKGSAPVAKRVHMLGGCILRWMKDTKPRIVEVENVPEWVDWGPLIQKKGTGGLFMWQRSKIDETKPKWHPVRGPKTGTAESKKWRHRHKKDGYIVRPMMFQDPARKGTHFKAFVRYCKRLGYDMDMRVLDAPDYGNASRRRRLFIKLRRDKMPIMWPEPTHGPKSTSGLPYRTAADCIDWNDLGKSIFDRKKPLKPKTLQRIVEGIRRYVVNDPSPFILRVTQPHAPGGGWHVYPSHGPAPTQTARQDLAVATPVVAHVCQQGSNGKQVNRADEPIGGMTTAQEYAIATPVVQLIRGETMGQDAKLPLPTITAGNGPGRGAGAGHALGIGVPILTPAGGPKRGVNPVDQPYHTILGRDDCAVAIPIVTRYNGEKPGDPANAHDVQDPLPTVPTENRFAIASPVLATTGYGERKGQRPRANSVADLLGTMVGGTKQGVVTPIMVGAGGSGYAGKPKRGDQHLNTVKGDHRQAVVTPVLIKNFTGVVGSRIDKPTGAVTTVDHHAVATPVLMNNTTGHTGGKIEEPMPTQTTGGQTGLVAPVMTYLRNNNAPSRVDKEPINAVTAGGMHAMLVAALVGEYYSSGSGKTLRRADSPLGMVPTKDRHQLVTCMIDGQEMVIVDILFRMLKPGELAAAMGFRADFKWPKCQRNTVMLIGNAVSPRMSRSLVASSLPRRARRKVA